MSDTNNQTVSHSDCLKLASTLATALDMLDRMLDKDGALFAEYEFVWTLFHVYNSIYKGGKEGGRLDSRIDSTNKNHVTGDIDNAHYHVSVAIGLAAGIFTSPGVPTELDHAGKSMQSANDKAVKLNNDILSIVKNSDTKNYLSAVSQASANPAVNVEILVKKILWTCILKINKQDPTKADLEKELKKIFDETEDLQDNSWEKIFSLDGLSINAIAPGVNDDFEIVFSVLEEIGLFATIASFSVLVYSKGINRIQTSYILRKQMKLPDLESKELEVIQEEVEMAPVSEMETMTLADALGAAITILGAVLLFVSTIAEIASLTDSLSKINTAKDDFETEYGKVTTAIKQAIILTEKFRPKVDEESDGDDD